jgi:uncharacterized protein YdhG (YjbR/CyaY superfamily)
MEQAGKSQAVMDYIATLPQGRRKRSETIHRLTSKLFPNATCDFSYQMPTYHVGEQFFAWKSQKYSLSVYTCSAERIAAFMKKHPEIPHGVGCINFGDHDPFPPHDLATVIKNALAPSPAILKREQLARKQATPHRQSPFLKSLETIDARKERSHKSDRKDRKTRQ